jgi:YD repeat-containing protein
MSSSTSGATPHNHRWLKNVTTNTYDARGRVSSSSDTRAGVSRPRTDELDRVLSKTTWVQRRRADSPDRRDDDLLRWANQTWRRRRSRHHLHFYAQPAVHADDHVADARASPTLTSQSHYDGNGNRSSEIDRRGIERTMGYDVLNRMRTVTVTGVGQVQEFTYDAGGNKLTESDIHNHTTTYEYDGLYRVARTVLPETPYTLRGRYDLNGQVLESWDAKGARQAKTFDGEFRVKSETNALGDDHVYDAIGNRTLESTPRPA